VSIRGGEAATESTALRSAPSTVLLTEGLDVELGSAPRAVGVSTTHGQLSLLGARVTPAVESVAEELIGIELVWADALVSATNELATTSLGYEEDTIISTISDLPDIPMYSLVALAGDDTTLQIGMAATPEDCMELSRTLLGMEPEDEELSEQDLVDALGEIVNVLAGGVKTRMAHVAASMRIGLPIVLKGTVNVSKSTDVSATLIRWDAAEAQLVLLRHNG